MCLTIPVGVASDGMTFPKECDNPDCVDYAVPDDIDGYPERMLPSEPICVITDDMSYQQKIEALNGTIYDYDTVCDSLPDYVDYDEPYDCEELCGLDGSVECEMCHDPCKLDVSGGETILSRARFGDRSDGAVSAPEPNITEDGNRLLLTDFDHSGDIESHVASFGDPFTYVAYAPAPTDTEVSNRSPSVKPNLLSDPGGETDSHRNALDLIRCWIR